jgi:hypothetical protein
MHASDELLSVSPIPLWSTAMECLSAKPRNIVHGLKHLLYILCISDEVSEFDNLAARGPTSGYHYQSHP